MKTTFFEITYLVFQIVMVLAAFCCGWKAHADETKVLKDEWKDGPHGPIQILETTSDGGKTTNHEERVWHNWEPQDHPQFVAERSAIARALAKFDINLDYANLRRVNQVLYRWNWNHVPKEVRDNKSVQADWAWQIKRDLAQVLGRHEETIIRAVLSLRPHDMPAQIDYVVRDDFGDELKLFTGQ